MWKKCAQSHRFGLGRVGGRGYHWGGGGSANREYVYMCTCIISICLVVRCAFPPLPARRLRHPSPGSVIPRMPPEASARARGGELNMSVVGGCSCECSCVGECLCMSMYVCTRARPSACWVGGF